METRTKTTAAVGQDQTVYFGSLRMDDLRQTRSLGSEPRRAQAEHASERERELQTFFQAVQAAWCR